MSELTGFTHQPSFWESSLLISSHSHPSAAPDSEPCLLKLSASLLREPKRSRSGDAEKILLPGDLTTVPEKETLEKYEIKLKKLRERN